MRPSRGLWHPAILVMQPTENRRRDHSTSRGEGMAGGDEPVSCEWCLWDSRSHAGMRTASVVTGHPLAKDPSKVALVERNQPVETLPTDRPDQALAECVGLRRRHGRLQDSQPHRRHGAVDRDSSRDAAALQERLSRMLEGFYVRPRASVREGGVFSLEQRVMRALLRVRSRGVASSAGASHLCHVPTVRLTKGLRRVRAR